MTTATVGTGTIDVDNLIVGFGNSSIPLLRELENSNANYKIISKGPTIWQKLHKANKLNFAMVSSYFASVFCQDQIDEGRTQDTFLTAKEFYEYTEEISKPFKDKVIEDKVTLIENYSFTTTNNTDKKKSDPYSLVYTESNQVYKAKKVVLGLGFRRNQNKDIMNFDFDRIQNKTVVLDLIGDTANMMLSKLIPNGNKCILVNNGFVYVEKDLCVDAPSIPGLNGMFNPLIGVTAGRSYKFDLAQFESHNLADWIPTLYKKLISSVWGEPSPKSWFMQLVCPELFHIKYPETYRARDMSRVYYNTPQAGIGNGIVAIKCHAIDMYQLRYGQTEQELYDNIKKGHLLNDTTFFLDQGLVEQHQRSQTSIDTAINTLVVVDDATGQKKVVEYDYYLRQGNEEPNLPPIVSVVVAEEREESSKESHHPEGRTQKRRRHTYKYNVRDTLLGVIPSNLEQVYLLGYIRPTTGGLSNITEMQSLLIHKLVSNDEFRDNVKDNFNTHMNQYDSKYYSSKEERNPKDYLVFSGFYTRDVARLIGIDRPVFSTAWKETKNEIMAKRSSSTSFMNASYFAFWWLWILVLLPMLYMKHVYFELFYANNAIKFRQEGSNSEYALKGAKEQVRKVFRHDEWNFLMFTFIMNTIWDLIHIQVTIGLLYIKMVLPLWSTIGLDSPAAFQQALLLWIKNFASNVITSADGGKAATTTKDMPALLLHHLDIIPTAASIIAFLTMATYCLMRHVHRSLFQYMVYLTYSLPAVPFLGLKFWSQPLFVYYMTMYGEWYYSVPFYLGWISLAWLFRQFHFMPYSGRYIMADCKYKYLHKDFWNQYQETFRRVQKENQTKEGGISFKEN